MGSFPINSCPKYGVWIERTLRRYGRRELNGEFSHKDLSERRGIVRVDTAALWEAGAEWRVLP